MRGGPTAHFRPLLQIGDGLALLVAFPVAYLTKTRLLPSEMTPLYAPEAYLGPALLVALATLFSLRRRGAYSIADLMGGSSSLAAPIAAMGQALIFAAACMFVFKLAWVSRLFVGIYGLTATILLCGARLLLQAVLRRRRAAGIGVARVVVVGAGPAATWLMAGLSEGLATGATVAGSLSPEAFARDPDGAFAELEAMLGREAVDEVAVAEGSLLGDSLGRLIEVCEREGVALHVAAEALAPGLGRTRMEEVAGIRLLSLSPQTHSAWQRAVKRVIDMVGAPIFLLVTLPLWVVAAIAIKLDSRGPVFFVQERIGLNKRRFRLYKFRSMVTDADAMKPLLDDLNEADGPIFKVRDDPRVTGVGRWLRRFDIDELPQLWNVVRGDMSLVGPRPMLASEIGDFEPWQRKRFSMLPGITGAWQVSARLGDPFLAGLRTDLEYIDTWSLWKDAEIYLRTIPAVLRNRVHP